MNISGGLTDMMIPVRNCTRQRGRLALPKAVTLASALAEDDVPLHQLKDELAAVGVRARVKPGAHNATVFVRRDRSLPHREGYRLTIGKEGVEIVSATAAGAYYGVQTLRDMLRVHGRRLPCCRIDDSPTFARRAVYHDCARGKVPKVETVKQLIEWLAHWKINELQLYIENAFTFARHPDIGKGFSPYTPDDILAMQAHAKKHHVRFVPSLTSFGHFEKILMLPKYQHLGELPGSRGMPGGTTLCPGDPGSIRLIADMYEEFLPLFEAEDFNVCGDEPWELGLGRSKRRAARVGVGRVYLDFILKLRDLCHRHGKRMNMWGDIVMKHPEILPDVPKDIVMLNWDYGVSGNRILRTHELRDLGLAFVCCPGTHNWASHGSRLKRALTNVSLFARAARENGAEGLMNTDWGNVGHRHFLATSLCSMAHGAAHGWCSEKVDDTRHVRRFCDLVFGDPDGAMAKAVTRLGEHPVGIDQPYFALLESLLKPRPLASRRAILGGFRIENIMTIDAIRSAPGATAKRIEAVRSIEWPKPTRPLTAFESSALDEYATAGMMEILGCEHINLARDLRKGRPVAPADLRRHADGLERCSRAFERLWRARNRPSRLRDNLAILRAGAKEARKLASR